MRRGAPIFSAEARAMCNRGPAWREHPDYYGPDEPEDEELVPEDEQEPDDAA
jgi:hypothetical protein